MQKNCEACDSPNVTQENMCAECYSDSLCKTCGGEGEVHFESFNPSLSHGHDSYAKTCPECFGE